MPDDFSIAALAMAVKAEKKIPSLVEDWLEDNVDPSTGYVIDNSLTIAGAAADAKKTGDDLTQLKSAIDHRLDEINTALNPAGECFTEYNDELARQLVSHIMVLTHLFMKLNSLEG